MAHYVKFLHANLTHHGYVYQEGLNCLKEVFNPSGACEPGGLYFTDFENVGKWCCGFGYTLVADVVLPPEAQVYAEPCGRKWKCDQMFLGNIRPIEQLFMEHPELCLPAVSENPWTLRILKQQRPEICLAAVQKNGSILEYVKDQLPEICVAAVRQSWWALRFVRDQTPEICLAAVQECGEALQYVQHQTPEICLAAVRHCWWALLYVKIQTPEICLAATQNNVAALEYVRIEWGL